MPSPALPTWPSPLPSRSPVGRPLLGLLVVGMVGLAGCAQQKMAVPPALASGAELMPMNVRKNFFGEVKEDAFGFGPYRVDQVAHQDYRSGERWKVKSMFKNTTDTTLGGYRYSVDGGRGRIQGTCSTIEGKELRLVPILGEVHRPIARVECQCQGAGVTAAGMVELIGGKWGGQFDAHGITFPLQAVATLENGVQVDTPRGYAIEGPGQTVAAVEIARPGRVWMTAGLDEQTRAEMACLFAGLWLYKPPAEI